MPLSPLLPTAMVLSGASALRASVPLLFLCLGYRNGWLPRPPADSLQAQLVGPLSSDVALWAFWAFLLLELLMDKFVGASLLVDLPLLAARPLVAALGPFMLLGTADPVRTVLIALGVAAASSLPLISLMGGTVQRSFGWRPTLLQWASVARDLIALLGVALCFSFPWPALAVLVVGTWAAGQVTRAAQLQVEAAEEAERLRNVACT